MLMETMRGLLKIADAEIINERAGYLSDMVVKTNSVPQRAQT